MNNENIINIIEKSQDVANVLKLLSHPLRLRIVCFLSEGKKTVGTLEELCSCSQSQMSQYLKALERENILTKEKDGKFVYYKLSSPEIKKLIKSMYKIFCS